MPLLPVTQQRRSWVAPAFLSRILRGVGRVVGAMADEAGFLVLAGIALAARLVWMFGAVAFVGAAVGSLAFWFNGMAADAWRATYAGVLALALMAAARFIENACIRYRSRGADF